MNHRWGSTVVAVLRRLAVAATLVATAVVGAAAEPAGPRRLTAEQTAALEGGDPVLSTRRLEGEGNRLSLIHI